MPCRLFLRTAYTAVIKQQISIVTIVYYSAINLKIHFSEFLFNI